MVAIELSNYINYVSLYSGFLIKVKKTSYTRFVDYCDRLNRFLKQNKKTRQLI